MAGGSDQVIFRVGDHHIELHRLGLRAGLHGLQRTHGVLKLLAQCFVKLRVEFRHQVGQRRPRQFGAVSSLLLQAVSSVAEMAIVRGKRNAFKCRAISMFFRG